MRAWLFLAAPALALGACDRPDAIVRTGEAETTTYRAEWLGTAEGWGLLGLPLRSGLLTYRSARSLEAPTWAPPEVEAVSAARAVPGGVWVRFADGQLGLLDYSTGRLRTFGELTNGARLAIPLPERSSLLIATDELLSIVGEGAPWEFALPGRLIQLDHADEGRVLAVVESGADAEAVILRPPERDPLGRADLGGIVDAVVTAWGQRLYYIPEPPGDTVVKGLSVPELRPIGELPLPQGGDALEATPSGHRLYVVYESRLHVFDRLAGRLVRSVDLPARVSELRFSETGSTLLGRVEGEDQVVVIQVGVDSVLGLVPTVWTEHVPATLPGGRLVTRPDSELVLYTVPDLLQIARVQERAADYLWIPVHWQPPRPRPELVRRVPGARDADARRESDERAATDEPEIEPAPPDTGPPAPGYYAVVLAARTAGGIDDLVGWLRSVGYRATRERHLDPMGVQWYRAMVGPYTNRPLAESAARNLSSRYGYKPWILTISAAEAEERMAAEDSVGDGAALPDTATAIADTEIAGDREPEPESEDDASGASGGEDDPERR